MSAETLEWLNENTLIGFTSKFGHAWHSLPGYDNHFEGAVPIERVRELVGFEVIEKPLTVLVNDKRVTDPRRKMLVAPDKDYVETNADGQETLRKHGVVLGIHGKSYKVHHNEEWLVDVVSSMLDDDLQIGSAGLLRNYAVCWVQVEVPETIETPEGVRFRPHLLCKTSYDGTLASTYGRSITNTVCDNTMAIASSEHGGMQYRIRHTANSTARLQDARDALKLVNQMADDFAAEVAALTATTVTDKQFDQFLESLFPTKNEDGEEKTRGQAAEKQASLRGMWREDERVAPWKNTAWGALQAVNTAQQHVFTTRGVREGANLTKKVYGFVNKEDQSALDALQLVLA